MTQTVSAENEPLAYQQDQSHRIRENVKRFYIYFVLALVVVLFSVVRLDEVDWFQRGHFLNPNNIINLLRTAVPIMTVAGAFTFLMIAEYIDLSIGSAMSLSAVVFSWLILNGFSFIWAVVAVIILGLVMGSLNAFLVLRLNIVHVIATLITLSLYKGIALLIVPEGLSAIKSTGEQKMPAWIILVVLQRKTLIGKYSAAIGGNKTAAELSGISVLKWVWVLYVLVGVSAALAGMARASYMSLGDPLANDGMEMWVIIAVLLGGTKFTGGEGNVEKTIIAALIIIVVTVGMLTVIPAYWQGFAMGAILLIAVVINHQIVRNNNGG
jgi:ribose/xylose/arabinose/galactoside ABC-type transport system permease subunit